MEVLSRILHVGLEPSHATKAYLPLRFEAIMHQTRMRRSALACFCSKDLLAILIAAAVTIILARASLDLVNFTAEGSLSSMATDQVSSRTTRRLRRTLAQRIAEVGESSNLSPKPVKVPRCLCLDSDCYTASESSSSLDFCQINQEENHSETDAEPDSSLSDTELGLLSDTGSRNLQRRKAYYVES